MTSTIARKYAEKIVSEIEICENIHLGRGASVFIAEEIDKAIQESLKEEAYP